jgi:phage terminase Nu1 subunit (DNA packaging protein)
MEPNTEAQPQFVETQADVAIAMGVNRHTVKEWLQQGAPRKTSAGYDIHAITEWRNLHKRTSDPTKDLDIPQEEFARRLLMAKLRRAEGEAIRAESEGKIKNHEALKTTEDVVHLDDVERFLSSFFGETRRVLMRIPKEMKNGYPEDLRQDLADDLEARLSIALRTMAGYCRRVTDLREV